MRLYYSLVFAKIGSRNWVIWSYHYSIYNQTSFLRVKYKYQVIVRLKTIEYLKDIFYYLSSLWFLPFKIFLNFDFSLYSIIYITFIDNISLFLITIGIEKSWDISIFIIIFQLNTQYK